MDIPEVTVRRAEELLTEWAVMDADRDARVLTALASGVRPVRIREITGLARTTIYRIARQAGTR